MLLLILGPLALVGCKTDPIVPDDLNPVPIDVIDGGELPSYRELVQQYNQNGPALERVWARTKVELRWRDEKNRKRRESGDGRLIFERPLNTAWTVEVLGDIKLWAGSDSRGFWLFDRLNDGTAYYGQYDRPLARPLPLPVQPEAVPYLLGLMPLDPGRVPASPAVELFNGYCVIEPPGLNLRMMLDPQTARPVRIDLTDAAGASVLVCRLSGEVAVEREGSDPVTLPETAELYPVGDESRMTVKLKRPSTDESRFKPKLFDFERLAKSMKPKEVVDLNALSAAGP
ncbi:MAG: hypothetical protein AAF333_03620 [Planctomycetota bacterium]